MALEWVDDLAGKPRLRSRPRDDQTTRTVSSSRCGPRDGYARKASTVPRHSEVNEHLARKICKDLEIPLP